MVSAPTATLPLPHTTLRGAVAYHPAHQLLELTYDTGETEALSTDLTTYGLVAAPGTVHVKDWSEHVGLASALQAAGLATIEASMRVGPFASRAHLVRPAQTTVVVR